MKKRDDISDKIILGERISNIRRRRGMTQEALAENLPSMSRTTLAFVETGKQRMNSDQCIDLAAALRISVTRLLTGKEGCEECDGSGECNWCHGTGETVAEATAKK